MVGILLALQVNNWNENRKIQTELFDIYSQIVFELDNDISELSSNLETYDTLKPIFDKVISDSRTIDLLDDGLSRLMTNNPRTVLNKSGIDRLKSNSIKDSLSLHLIEIYGLMENVYVLPVEKVIAAEGTVIANTFRDNYSWYPEWISKRITKENSSQELQDYFVYSQEYRHYVVSSYQQIYNNYMPALRILITNLKKNSNRFANKNK